VRTFEGRQIWGRQYRRNLGEMGDIEPELATEIAKSLQVHLSDEDSARIGKRHTINGCATQK